MAIALSHYRLNEYISCEVSHGIVPVCWYHWTGCSLVMDMAANSVFTFIESKNNSIKYVKWSAVYPASTIFGVCIAYLTIRPA